MKNILIIGGCGYIGSALFQTFADKHHVTTVDLEWFGNFNNPSNIKVDFGSLTSVFLDEFDVVILVAANSSVPLCADLFDTFDNNVTKFAHLVKRLKKQKFIYASSSCVYVTSDGSPKVETDPLGPIDGLTLTKTTIDGMMPLTHVEYYGLRLGSVAGWSPNMRLDLMVNAMTISGLYKHEVNVFNAHAHRPMLAMSDLCRAVETIVECPEDRRGIYNLASVNHNIGDVGRKVADHLGVPLVDKGSNFTYDFQISSEKFKQTFDFRFEGTVENMSESIAAHPYNLTWKKRESK